MTSSTAIVASLKGAYEPKVRLEGEDKLRPLTEVVNMFAQNLGATPGSVATVFSVSNHIGDAAKNTDTFNFSGSALPGRLVHVPSVVELGYAAGEYKMQAIVVAHLRSDTPPTDVEVRLVDASGVAVSGSLAAGSVKKVDTDDIVKSTPFDIQPGGYAVDMRLVVDGAAQVTLLNKALLLRVVKI